MSRLLELVATVEQQGRVVPEIVNHDGTRSPFSIPNGSVCVIRDISIQRTSVVADPGFFHVSLTQDSPTGSQIRRWCFVGVLSQNLERSFTNGLVFSTPFVIENGSQSADVVAVRLWGFLDIL